MTNPIIFDRKRYLHHLTRASAAPEEFLLRELADRLCERLLDMSREFSDALVISPLPAVVAEYIPASAGVKNITHHEETEEEILPFEANQFDLLIHCGGLHWVNDLAGMLIQIQRVLKPDGLFLAMIPGGETLKELRQSFEAAEMIARGGISPRVSPFVDIRDAGALLQRAGFALPVVDSQPLTVAYKHPFKLMRELRAMGQTNALLESAKHFTPCSLMMQMVDQYFQQFTREEDGRIAATFELITMTAWKPHASQQQPLARGSGKTHLTDIL
jgi:ubiquinone/menaquinone biosynthesis C-methylase UbiE